MTASPVPVEVRDRIRALLDEGRPRPEDWIRRLRTAGGGRIPACSCAVRELLHVSMDEADAERLLRAILDHRDSLAGALGRDPGLAVSALDYATAVVPLLRDPVALERRELDGALARSEIDPSTSLLRREPFLARMGRETARARRRPGRIALVVIAIDGFRAGVDRYGHRLGEAMIRELSDVVRDACRGSDVAARLDGDRFAVLLPGTDRTGAFTLAERIRSEAGRSLADRVTESHPGGPTLSGGIAVSPDDAASAEELLDRATRGLNAARANGGDAVSLFHDERRASVRRPVHPESRVALTSEDGIAARAIRAIDLSTDGVLVEADAAFPVGARVHVYAKRPGPAGTPQGWSSFARVVRLGAAPGGRRRLGMRFDRSVPGDVLGRLTWSGAAPSEPVRARGGR